MSPKHVPNSLGYTVKVINVNRKSQYVVRKFRSPNRFASVRSLQEYVTEQTQEEAIDIGFIEPGHGMKGKQVWIVEDEDLATMYSLFNNKKDIILWCHVRKSDECASAANTGEKTKKSSRKHTLPDSSKTTMCHRARK